MVIQGVSRRVIILLLVIVTCSIGIFYSLQYAYAKKTRTISYFPRNEELDTKYQTYSNKILGEVYCEPAADLFQQQNDCIYCVNTLKIQCPDCCLNLNPTYPRAIKCTEDDISDDTKGWDTPALTKRYKLDPVAFEADATLCPQAPLCAEADAARCSAHNYGPFPSACGQVIGCPGNAPSDLTPQGNVGGCVPTGVDDQWYCQKEDHNATPQDTGCTVRNAAIIASNNGQTRYPISHCVAPYYNISEKKDPCPDTGYATCYQYDVNPDFSDCMDTCTTYTEDWQRGNNRISCCKNSTCSSKPTPGYEANCSTPLCKKRVEFPACDSYTAQSCIDLGQQALDCLLNATGACSSCYKEIDSNFFYKFVAKSRMSSVVYWQIDGGPLQPYDVETYFYSKVRIFEVQADGTEVLITESIPHQKHLLSAFSIFCATYIPRTLLTQGKAYRVRLYYFLPQIDTDNNGNAVSLQFRINNLRLIMVKIRE